MANMLHCDLASVQNCLFIVPYMGLFALKLDQRAPCFHISEMDHASQIVDRKTEMKDYSESITV
jgi:hypothetical protein